MPKAGFYAVRRGKQPGIYSTWEECKAQTDGFPRAEFKRFGNLKDAENFVGVVYIETSLTKLAPTYKDSPSPSAEASASGQPPVSAAKTTSASTSTTSRFKPYSIPPNKGKPKVDASSSKFVSDDDWIIAYTDGACRGNGREGATAGVGVWYGDNDPRNVSERCPGGQTNNRAELIAIIRCLEEDLEPSRALLIRSDSKYAMDCVTSWMPAWEKNGWRTKGGKDVSNKAVIQYLAELVHERPGPVRFEHVLGHSGEKGNDGADRLAVAGASLPETPERSWIAPPKTQMKNAGPSKSTNKIPAGLVSNANIVEDTLLGLDEPLFTEDELNSL